jgi:hypothetical protein
MTRGDLRAEKAPRCDSDIFRYLSYLSLELIIRCLPPDNIVCPLCVELANLMNMLVSVMIARFPATDSAKSINRDFYLLMEHKTARW